MRRSDGARRALAIGRAPALGEPGGRIVVERIGACQDQVAVASDRAQHCVGKRREWRAGRIGARRLDREVDGRMIGRIEKEDLRRGDDERPLEGPPRFGIPFSIRRANALRIVPSRRSATVAIERASARSRGSKPPARSERSAASRSSSGRARVSASATARAAATRAAMPGGVGAGVSGRPA